MCSFLEWSPEIWTAIGTFLTAGFTLGLILVANKGFKKLLSQEAGKAQLKLMLDFVDNLANEKITISELSNEKNYLAIDFFTKSLLEYTSEDLRGKSREDILITENGFTSVAFSYLQRPLMPNSVVKRIKEFRDLSKLDCKITTNTVPQKLYYIPGGTSIDRVIQLKMIMFSEGLPNYIQACLNLKTAVRDWFSKHGVSDLNSDFIPL